MLLRTIILGVIIFACGEMQAQSLIGLPKEEVKQHIKKELRDFAHDNTVIKQEFNYLKYVNGGGTITYIIYFSDNDIATSTKKVCDYLEYDFVLDELNEKYEKAGKMKWTYSDDHEKYNLTLEEKDWYFTVRERREKNK